jgi:NAD(P)-dependent dehydrogenase (short-subunit alcohol dehydrogenase family)
MHSERLLRPPLKGASLMKTVFITGCSSGFGLETARHFLEKGWKVVATMRNPKADLFPKSDALRILPLDVTRQDSIKRAVAEAGSIDVLVNNAGIGMLNALEGVTLEQIRELYETNLFGTMALIQAVLPQMRERKAGVIVNVSSSTTSRPLPLLSVYTGSKAAMNHFTTSLQLELAPFNIRTRVVLPGRSMETQFAANALSRMGEFPKPYQEFANKIFDHMKTYTGPVTHPKDVAEAVYFAATDPSSPMFIPAGEDAKQAEAARIAEKP